MRIDARDRERFTNTRKGIQSDSVEPALSGGKLHFTCNICASRNLASLDFSDREKATCESCGSSARLRSVLLVLSRALFDADLPLVEFPTLKSIRGIGISDSEVYASGLEQAFSYHNTYFHKEPKFDLREPDEREFGKYDFVVCSEVLEHVAPPVDRAFETLARLLTPTGILILTLPYSIDATTIEHFPGSAEFALVEINDKTILVSGDQETYRVFDQLSFHGGHGSTVEMRLFSESDIRKRLFSAGLADVRIGTKSSKEFGVVFSGPCSLPITASREGFFLRPPGINELIQQLIVDRKQLKMAGMSRWVRLGRRLGLGPAIDFERRRCR